MRPSTVLIALTLLLCMSLSLVRPVFGLQANELLVVANGRMRGSEDLAKYYMEKRKIPESRLLTLSLVLGETMERWDYHRNLAVPVREKIAQLRAAGERIAAIVLVHGVPLKVLAPEPSWEEREKIRQMLSRIDELDRDNKLSSIKKQKKKQSLTEEVRRLERLDYRSAVDSELALVKKQKYRQQGWMPNPYFLGFHGKKLEVKKDDVLLVARLDGPNPETVYRMIDDSLAAEQKGLRGKGYFDGRWKRVERAESPYRRYDNSLYRAAEIVRERLEVVVDDTGRLFGDGECPATALYCGWYSLGRYIDAFSFERGAIGYHMASSECGSLRQKNRQWCQSMLRAGAAATIGPVYEPYIQGFPLPEIFFGKLVEGYMSLGEAYLVSLPYISWQMVLLGDPLYQPFRPATSP